MREADLALQPQLRDFVLQGLPFRTITCQQEPGIGISGNDRGEGIKQQRQVLLRRQATHCGKDMACIFKPELGA